MKRVLIWGAAALGLALLATSVFIVRTLTDMGAFTTLKPHFGGTCAAIAGVEGAEDVVVDRERNIAFLSSVDFRAVLQGREANGRIAALDLAATPPRVLAVGVDGALDRFRPHGLSLAVAPDGARVLFAVSHRSPTEHAVEIFDVAYSDEGPRLSLRRSVTGPALVSPNDVAGLPDGTFYATNDHGTQAPLGQRLEEVFRKPRSTLVRFDGSSLFTVADGLVFANGIALSNDATRLYVAEMLGHRLRIYVRDPATGDIRQGEGTQGLVWIGTAADNIDVDPEGALWVAAHPKFLDLAGLVGDPRKSAPSQILEIAPNTDKPGGTIDEIYLSKGEELSAATVAVHLRDRMLLGSAFEPKVLLCELPEKRGMLDR
ncbi:MAG: SMP-30/gluconolactonase/LRE family protein [Alphaproteobacteria bacterium]|nr:SMP-30/gluconolactonase/LRE family protein [Alphaproteobacteria bacterium]